MGLCSSRAALPPTEAVEPQAEPSTQKEDPKETAPADGPGGGPQEAAAWAYHGAPRPPNDGERVALLQSLGVLDGPDDEEPSQFDAITRLLCAVFGVPIALVSLVDAERQWFKSVQGLGPCIRETDRNASFCAWTLLPDQPNVMVVEDALQDARFAENPLVCGAPFIRFYAGTPLISSANGYRYGTLCVIDTRPRQDFSSEQYNVLIQFAELCVREIEKDKLTVLQKLVQQQAAAAGGAGGAPGASTDSSLAASALPSGSVTPSSARPSTQPSRGPPKAAAEEVVAGQRLTVPSLATAAAAAGMAAAAAAAKGAQPAPPRKQPPPQPPQLAVQAHAPGGLSRAAECFREGVVLVDVSSSTWSLLYANDAFCSATGVPRDEVVSQGFWELFAAPGQGPASYQEAVESGEAFSVAVSLHSIYSRTPRPATIDFRPAASAHLRGPSEEIGIPAEVPSAAGQQQQQGASAAQQLAEGPGLKLYFAIVRSDSVRKPPLPPSAHSAAAAALSPFAALAGTPTSPGGSGTASPAPGLADPAPKVGQRGSLDSQHSIASTTGAGLPPFKRAMPSAFTDVRLGPLIGRGAYGRVYRGSWNGTTVAVKVIETSEPLETFHHEDGGLAPGKSGIFEAVLSSNLSHPNIVHTYQYAFRPTTQDESERVSSGTSSSQGTGKSATEIWLVSEFCNRGPLLTAIERGAFLTQPSSQYGQPNLISVLQTLQEVAAALQYLHRNDVLHGDLTGGNVLLTASDKDTRGFTAKVVDFGLSRVCSGDYLRTRTLGCAEYMPPELITEGILTKAADVYAFGVITWEMYCGRRAWDGLKPTEVLRRVAQRGRLDFPAQTPHRLKILGERCMEYAPASRPTMEEVLSEVNSILSDTMGILQQFLAASSAGNGGGGSPYPLPTSTCISESVSELLPSDPFRNSRQSR